MNLIQLCLAVRLKGEIMHKKNQKPFLSKSAIVNDLALITVIGIGLYIVITFATMPRGSETSSHTVSEREVATERQATVVASVLCQQEVKQGLKSHSSANFPWAARTDFDGKTAIYTSYVDASNSFGAIIRTNFVCRVEHLSGDPDDYKSWELKELVIESR